MTTQPIRISTLVALLATATACGSSSSGGGGSLGGSSGTGGTPDVGSTAGNSSISTTNGGAAATGGSGAAVTTGGQVSNGGQPTGGDAWAPSAACVQRAGTLANSMTLAQRIGQMTVVDSGSLNTSVASSGFLGGVLSGGGTHPAGGDNSVAGFSSLIASYLNVAKSFSPHAGLLYGLDAVHGNGKVVNAVIFPHAIGLGATRNATLVQNVGRITAQEMLGVGANWSYAPTVAPARDIRWGRTYETFSSEPDLTSQLAAASVLGMQNGKLGSSQSILACAKHFAGDAATEGGKNTGNTTLAEAQFRTLSVDPYRASISAGVGSIMASYSSYQGTKMTEFTHWLTDVLKTELSFKGFVVSDWDAVGRLPDSGWNNQVTAAVNAGIDMIMLSGSNSSTDGSVHTAAQLATALTSLVNAGTVPASRVIDAVTRILTIKCEMGLLDGDTSVDTSVQIGSAANRAVARDAVRQSQVVLKNDGLLPLAKTPTRVHVTGSGADNLAKQCGGWTLGWQGLNDAGASPTTGTTVLAAVKKRFTGTSTTVTSSTDGTGATGATYAIVVVGEAPYAETQGDSTNPTLTAADFAAIAAVKATNVPFVTVLFSGRPLILTDSGGTSALTSSNAFIASWLPGTEGDGIADVLFGDYKPTGKLSFEWPSSVSQLPLNVGDGKTPLFEFGFGLTYP